MRTTRIEVELSEHDKLELVYQPNGPRDDGVPHITVKAKDSDGEGMVHLPMDKLDALLPWLERMREQAWADGEREVWTVQEHEGVQP